MKVNPLHLIKSLLVEFNTDKTGSLAIYDSQFIKKFVDDPNFPFLVSFPRTGSHWLRMVMELYFEKPSLVRVFYYKDCQDYLTLHTHDMNLDIYRKNVIYLYREPAPTVYSQMMYEKEDTRDLERVKYWSTLYGKHLAKWLIEETETEKKTIMRYENLLKDMATEFSKVTEHFEMQIDADKLQRATEKVSKEEVKKKTAHDPQVINRSGFYEISRKEFLQNNSELIGDLVLEQNCQLQQYFI
ncbi:sulfotransferase domain-containing protein [Microcoleus sp. FACHB-68]|uniref:sulfotransferase domain-containing protein n=1 Tax=Microcoleus sp. FACHB-68 TaxID=2692826 RepID=UPI0016820922|nr:sulfotransferase domain-containing protein [Microcoleus sp. FACHB-68]MBD1936509.1 sulfotransferase domain-containing protein [Microcoleus sp. FACHB-68]